MHEEDSRDWLVFAAEDGPRPSLSAAAWRVLVVDDDDEVHEATAFALGGMAFFGCSLELLHARSAATAVAMLRREKDIAVILLDVVMETPSAGLDIVAVIRGELGLQDVRIILRTGQPGYAPEIETIKRYDINDYKTKSELTRTKLFATLSAALRTYDQLRRTGAVRSALELIIAAERSLLAIRGEEAFAQAALLRLAEFVAAEPDGLICAAHAPDSLLLAIAAAGRYAEATGRPLDEVAAADVSLRIRHCMEWQRNMVEHDGCALRLSNDPARPTIAYLHWSGDIRVDERLLEVFCGTIAAGVENVRLLERLRAAAYVDMLTGLASRQSLIEHLDIEAAAGSHRDCALALIDIDQFSAINDMFGHGYGDQLLRAVGNRLTAGLADSCLVARIGCDTFAVFGDAQIVQPDVLRPLFKAPFRFDDMEHALSVSTGIVRAAAGASDSADLLKDAWIALKNAKLHGRGQDVFYTADAGEETRERMRLLNALRQAFRFDHLFLVYQPQFDLASGAVTGVEALLRWRCADGSFIAPDRFIPIAESSGLIVELGEWVLHTALRAADEISRLGHRGITMAVNVAAAQFARAGFLGMLDDALRRFATEPRSLELEITESVAVMGPGMVEDLLAAIKQRGVSVAIDDFGTGYSSLSYLDRLPADRIKIDRAFVNALQSGARGARIAEMVIPLGNQLGMKVLAEGVETEAQAARLRAMGCHEAQGFFFARPMPLAELLEWLAGRGDTQ